MPELLGRIGVFRDFDGGFQRVGKLSCDDPSSNEGSAFYFRYNERFLVSADAASISISLPLADLVYTGLKQK